jgi:diguanylate cyclase (GGDEF)-like protein/PAS domain S-box-containing protein
MLRRVQRTGRAIVDREMAGETPAGAGRRRHWLASFYPVPTRAGEPVSVGAVVFETTKRTEAERRLRDSEERYRVLVETAPTGLLVVDPDGRVVLANAHAQATFGYGADELLGEPVETLIPSRLRDEHGRERVAYQARPAPRPMGAGRDLTAVRKDGSEFPVEVSLGPAQMEGRSFVTAFVADISERKRLEERLTHLALHDALTGLPNRALFLDRLELALARLNRDASRVALLFFDLDRFKVVNDSLGHDAGDRLLVQTAARLRRAVRPSDTVARLGGDEFAVLCEGLADEMQALPVAERILDALRAPVSLDDHEVVAEASIGISSTASPARGANALLRDADVAMYRAKEQGGGRLEFFEAPMHAKAVKRLDIEAMLRRAVEEDGFYVVFQPIADLATGRLVGAEALARWDHRRYGEVGPADFIPVAEETGLITAIGRFVIDTACRQAARWRAARGPGAPPLTTFVNLSPTQTVDPALPDVLHQALADADPGTLCLEITESVLLKDTALTERALSQLKRVGARLALDDFGTGYSSLGYLRRFPFDLLKIDRSFVADLDQHADHRAIVQAITSMGHALGLNHSSQSWQLMQNVAYPAESKKPTSADIGSVPACPSDKEWWGVNCVYGWNYDS